MAGRALSEKPTVLEEEDLRVHVEKCHLRYMAISDKLGSIHKLLWIMIGVMIASAIGNGLVEVWFK